MSPLFVARSFERAFSFTTWLLYELVVVVVVWSGLDARPGELSSRVLIIVIIVTAAAVQESCGAIAGIVMGSAIQAKLMYELVYVDLFVQWGKLGSWFRIRLVVYSTRYLARAYLFYSAPLGWYG